MPTSEQLAREARASRERLSRTLDELRARATPTNLVEEVTDYLRRASEPLLMPDETPRRSRYTLPLALVGAGLTWLALEARRAERDAARRERFTPPSKAVVAEEVAVAIPPSAPDRGPSLTTVETVSIAPAPIGSAEEKHDQRPLPL